MVCYQRRVVDNLPAAGCVMGEFVEDTLVGVFSRFVNLFTNKMLGESFNTMRSRYQRWLINIIARVKSGICCKISLNRLMTYGLRTARHREDIAERVG